MLHILWLVIKWILILLGILLGLLLLILLLVLFCPVRYRGKISKERNAGLKETEAFGEVSWLFHGISVRLFFRKGSPGMEFCILGFPLSKLKGLFRKKKKKNHTSGKMEKKKKSSGPQKQEADREKEIQPEVSIIKESDNAVPLEIIPSDSVSTDTEDVSKQETGEMDEEPENRIRSLIFEIAGKIERAVHGIFGTVRRIFGIPSRIFQKIQNFTLTIKKFCGKINWYKELIDHPRTRAALSLLWKDAKKLVRHVLPTRITGRLIFGCEDPSVTGTVLAFLGMTIPFHKNAVAVTPLFDSGNILEGEVVLRGRIYGVILLKTAAELYFNKNIKYVIRRWRHKEVNHGERE